MIELNLPLFYTRNFKKYSYLYNGCYKLTIKIDESKFNLRNAYPSYVKIIDIID